MIPNFHFLILLSPYSSIIMAVDLQNYDEEQVRLMEEMCIVIDKNDKRIGAESKKTCKYWMIHLFLHGSGGNADV